ncbi:MAG: glycosyltransferase family 9 protein [Ignavibacteria bacterium]|jgi:ADP-heptose:LPS heptosyltransferase
MTFPDKKKILITRTDKLGDVILTLPLISEVRRIFPESEISFLTKSFAKDLIVNYPSFDKLIALEYYEGFFSFLKFLRKEKFDIVINVYPRFELALLFFLAGIKCRIGTGYRWYSFLYNKKSFEHRKYATKHESEYNIDLLKIISKDVKYNRNFFFSYLGDEKQILEKKINKDNLSLSEKYIIVHPGSKGSARDWSIENFKLYIKKFLEEFKNTKIVLTGIKAEENIVNEISNSIHPEFRNNFINLCSKLNLKELMILIDNSKLFVSNSTGPIHIAGALNKNIIGFYPNQAPMNETRWKPLSDNAVILKPENMSGDMDEIKVENVISETKKFM